MGIKLNDLDFNIISQHLKAFGYDVNCNTLQRNIILSAKKNVLSLKIPVLEDTKFIDDLISCLDELGRNMKLSTPLLNSLVSVENYKGLCKIKNSKLFYLFYSFEVTSNYL